MLIKPIEKLYVPGGNIIETNKLRMKSIQNNINDMSLVEYLFTNLEKAILERDIIEIDNIVSKQLFFEILCDGFENKIIESYEQQINKKYFIGELRKSYVIRGVKGIQFAWMPIILRKG